MKQTKPRLAAAYALDLVVHTRSPWLWLAQVAAEAVVTAMMVPVSIPDQPNHPLVKQLVVSVRLAFLLCSVFVGVVWLVVQRAVCSSETCVGWMVFLGVSASPHALGTHVWRAPRHVRRGQPLRQGNQSLTSPARVAVLP